MSAENYIIICSHIATRNGLFDGKLHADAFPDIVGSSYNSYATRAKKKGLDFSLTQDEFDDLRKRECYICGNQYSHLIGVDRVNNSRGYTLDNCKPCCNMCNLIKREYTLDSVLSRCADVAKLHSVDINNIVTQKSITNMKRNKMTKSDGDSSGAK